MVAKGQHGRQVPAEGQAVNDKQIKENESIYSFSEIKYIVTKISVAIYSHLIRCRMKRVECRISSCNQVLYMHISVVEDSLQKLNKLL